MVCVVREVIVYMVMVVREVMVCVCDDGDDGDGGEGSDGVCGEGSDGVCGEGGGGVSGEDGDACAGRKVTTGDGGTEPVIQRRRNTNIASNNLPHCLRIIIRVYKTIELTPYNKLVL